MPHMKFAWLEAFTRIEYERLEAELQEHVKKVREAREEGGLE